MVQDGIEDDDLKPVRNVWNDDVFLIKISRFSLRVWLAACTMYSTLWLTV